MSTEEHPSEGKSRVEAQDSRAAVNRIAAFSDGVFAIAMTLLIVSISVPELHGDRTSSQLWTALGSLFPSLFSFTLSFAVIARFWRGHHARFRYIYRYDAGMIWYNFAFLFFIVVLPLPTAILGKFGDLPPALIVYAATLGLAGATQQLFWWHAARRNRLTEGVSDQEFVMSMWGAAIVPAIFVLSIPVAFLSPNATYAMWVSCFFMPGVISKIIARRIGASSSQWRMQQQETEAI